jgi:hypothetical protein
MGLEIRKNRFAKHHENDFFRVLSRKLSELFDDLKLDGLLIGSPVCSKNEFLQLDLLLVTESTLTIIDLKDYGGALELPEHDNGDWITYPSPNNKIKKAKLVKGDTWNEGPWIMNAYNGKIQVGGGSETNMNPFMQLFKQKKRLVDVFNDHIVSGLFKDENFSDRDIKKMIGFHQNVDLLSEIDQRVKHMFFIADNRNIVNKIADIVDVTVDEWGDDIRGNKFSQNTLDKIKSIFLAESYDPFKSYGLDVKEFDEIEYPAPETTNQDELINKEFKQHENSIEEFINTSNDVLIVNGDATSCSIGFVSRIIDKYCQDKDDIDDGNQFNVVFLAPTNRNVKDLIRMGAPATTKSLFGKLYDFENTSVELLNNEINEQEVFPLLKNEDEKETIYVLYYSHLTYDFGAGSDDLIKFGSGSLCKDALEFFNLKENRNKLILVNDPYFYGYRANTISSPSILSEFNLVGEKVDLVSKPIENNHKSAVSLVDNIKKERYNHFEFKDDNNVSFLFGDEYKNTLLATIKSKEINNLTILTREKEDSIAVNKWIRKEMGVNTPSVVVGDLLLIKNKILVPEILDPFSIPTYVLSGDIAEVLKVIERNSFKSSKYNLPKIEITKCKVFLRDYDSERFIYVLDKSINFLSENSESIQDIKKHIQIRKQEIVNEYLEREHIELTDLFGLDDYKTYQNELDQVKKSKGLFENSDLITNEKGLEKKIKSINAKWKVNKRKEKFVKAELMKHIDSEFFQLSEIGYYTFAWSMNLKSSYGYILRDCFMVKFPKIHENIARFHKYLYSGLIASKHLTFHDFVGIRPWVSLELPNGTSEISEKSKKKLVVLGCNSEFDAKDKVLSKKFNLDTKAPQLQELCKWVHNKIQENQQIEIQSIDSSPYLEKYSFTLNDESALLQFDYNKKWEVKRPRPVNDNHLSKLLIQTFDESELIPLKFDPNENWRSYEYRDFQERLSSLNLFITSIDSSEWKDELTICSENDTCVIQLSYGKSGFFSYGKFIYKSDDEIVEKVIVVLNQLKNE